MKTSTAARAAFFGAIATVGMTSVASAATMTASFDFTTANTGWQSSLNYSSNGIDLTVSADKEGGSATTVATWSGYGLGAGGSYDDSHQVDSKGLDDIVSFDFSQDVQITSITFNAYYSQSWDRFTLTADGGFVGNYGGTSSLDVTTALASSFGIQATGSSSFWTQQYLNYTDSRYMCDKTGYDTYKGKQYTCYSAFKITGMTVKWDTPPEVVPLPAASWLLLGGLGGLAALRRRKR